MSDSPSDPRTWTYVANTFELSWERLKQWSSRDLVTFTIAEDTTGLEFYMGPDLFEGSTRFSWTTEEERTRGPFLDHRVRSNDPDDFLSRIAALVASSR